MLDKAKYYLEEVFSIVLERVELEVPSVPVQLRGKVKVNGVTLNNVVFYCVQTENENLLERNGVVLLNNLLKRLNQHPVLFLFSRLSERSAMWLIDHRIGFVVPGSHSYIPQFLFHSRSFRSNQKLKQERLGLVPTMVVARYLEGELGRTFSSSPIIRGLDISRSAVSRALKELEGHGLIEALQEPGRKVINYHFLHTRKTIWELKGKLLSSIAGRVITTPAALLSEPNIICGESALSLYSLMGEPPRPCRAVFLESQSRYGWPITPMTLDSIAGDYLLQLADKNGVPTEVMEQAHMYGKLQKQKLIDVQVFPYRPLLLELRGKLVLSPLSLYLSIERFKDPRFEMAIAQLEKLIVDRVHELDREDGAEYGDSINGQ